MKTWFTAVCDVCGTGINLFVSNPSCTAHYLSEHDVLIQKWLEDHAHCGKGVRLLDMNGPLGDELYNNGWESVRNSPVREIVRISEKT